MPIQLDKILADIAEEKMLHPNYPNPNKKLIDEAWIRVGRKNKLNVHECRSIFKVLQKKYEQERVKESSAWKLFNIMDDIHKKVEVKVEVKHEAEPDIPMEEDEEYEMLEVQEDEEHPSTHSDHSTAATKPLNVSGNEITVENPNKLMKPNSSTDPTEKEEKVHVRNLLKTAPQEERKLLNSMQSVSNKTANPIQSMNRKSISLRKISTSTTKAGSSSVVQNKTTQGRGPNNSILEVGTTIQLPESVKRKLSEEHNVPTPIKRSNLLQAAVTTTAIQQQLQQQQHVTVSSGHSNNNTSQITTDVNIKQEHEDESTTVKTTSAHGISVITIPGNPIRNDIANGVIGIGGPSSSAAATVAPTSTNGGFSPRLEEIDFRNDIIFDSGSGQHVGLNNVIGQGQQQQNQQQQQCQQQPNINRLNHHHHHTSEVINLGNFDNSLPPTFFKNLCNSSRHEALGLYVANVMNRLGTRSAAKLELGILRAIIDVQSDELEQ